MDSGALLALADTLDELVHVRARSGEVLWSNPAFSRATGPDGRVRAPAARSLTRDVRWEGVDAELIVEKLLPPSPAIDGRAQETNYRTLFDTVMDGIFVADREGRFVEVNHAACAQLGYSREELLAMRVADLSARPDFAFAPLFERVQRVGSAVRATQHRRKDGGISSVELALVLVEHRGAPALLGVARDISDHERTEAELRDSEARFGVLFEAAPDAYIIHDTTGRVIAGNRAAEILTGLRREDAIGKDLLEVTRVPDPDDAERLLHLLEVQRAGHATGPDEIRIARPDGALVPIELRSVPIHFRGDTLVLVIARDVSVRKDAEEELTRLNAGLERRVADRTSELREANAALERASHAKDQFLAGMSHELRTPLNAVLGLSEALREGVYGPVVDRQQRALGRIEESGRHLLALIGDILDLSKIEAGKTVLQLRPIDVHEICRASMRMVNEAAHKKQLRVTFDVDGGLSVLHADERRLKQILVNLLGNAVKFTPAGGAIGLEVVVDEARARFTVWDTGLGISCEDRARLFQPFVQLDSGLARHSGTGLGLALVRKLAELHGGSADVQSELGRGSRFEVVIPTCPPSAMPDEAAPPSDFPPVEPPAAARLSVRGRILLAEDDEMNVATVIDFLRSRGHEVFVAHDGHAAVDQARRLRPDVILMDAQMPGMDGLAAIQAIRADDDPGLRRVPIIAVTALAGSGDRARALAAGADDYLSKPVGLRALAAAIEAQISGDRGAR